ncbi:MAG TPA: hypothetical protein VEJ63_13265 [Planctomycetota bacterium]|nr:hypothetical protein [Planctomycetota bacterium]
MSAEHEEIELAQFQAALLSLLDQELTAEEMLARMKSDPAFAPFKGYVEQFDLRAVEVAAEITKKWGKKAEQHE